MGKKTGRQEMRTEESPNGLDPQPLTHQGTQFPADEKHYVEFFEFLKEVHLAEREEKQSQKVCSSLDYITQVLMNFFNRTKEYSARQLECSTICLANLFNVIGNRISRLTYEKEFVNKLRRFACDLSANPGDPTQAPKVQAILYILVALIYKERIGGERGLRQLNKSIFNDRILVRSLLDLRLPQDRKAAKFYGIVILHLSSRKNSHLLKKAILRSILLNLGRIEHPPTTLNLLVYLRSEKNKVSLNLADLIQGQVVALLSAAYPRHIQDYQSFYILDYLLHLVGLFPSLAAQVVEARFVPYLLETAGLAHLHHPLHEATIISFVQTTLKFLEVSTKQQLVEVIARCQPPNHYLTIKLAQMLVDHQADPGHLAALAHQGYFDRLLTVLTKDPEDALRRQALELYLQVVQSEQIPVTTGHYLMHKARVCVSGLSQSQLSWLVPATSPPLQLI